MKKFITLALALILTLSMTVCAFAEDGTGKVDANNGTQAIEVTGKYRPADVLNTVSVNLSWNTLAFEYKENAGEWDSTNHTYGATTGSWNTGTLTVTVTNNSSCNVKASMTIADANDTDSVTVAFGEGTLEATAAGWSNGALIGEATTEVATLSAPITLTGKPTGVTANTPYKIATVTVTIVAQ